MNFVISDMKVDQLIAYINSEKINLIPAFQRGSVWTGPLRKKLLSNIIKGRPIPAIFLYKEESGSMYAYSILDGKQRLESIMLFVGNLRPDLRIGDLKKYFWAKSLRRLRNFEVSVDGESLRFKDLDESYVRNFREYAIPTIEISLEGASMAEIIELFVDINSYGVKVSRFDVAKAMVKDPFLGTVFDLIAVKQERGKTIHYKAKASPINKVMSKLTMVARLQPSNTRVDRVWERLAEIALFERNKKHRRQIDMLKAFIKGGEGLERLTKPEVANIRTVFSFLSGAYSSSQVLSGSRLAGNEPPFTRWSPLCLQATC